jgi:hypothetical protein
MISLMDMMAAMRRATNRSKTKKPLIRVAFKTLHVAKN